MESKAKNNSHTGPFNHGAGIQVNNSTSPTKGPRVENTGVRQSSVSPLQKGSTNRHYDEAKSRPTIPRGNMNAASS